MKYTNEGFDERVYPTLGVILQPGESFDDAKGVIKDTQTPSVKSDIIISEVK